MAMNKPVRFVIEISVIQALNTLTDGHCYVSWQQNLGFQRQREKR